MFVRTTNIKVGPEKLDRLDRFFREEVLPKARELEGFEGANLLENRETGELRTMVYWSSRETLQASQQFARTMGTRLVESMELTSALDFETYEVVLQEGRTPMAKAA